MVWSARAYADVLPVRAWTENVELEDPTRVDGRDEIKVVIATL